MSLTDKTYCLFPPYKGSRLPHERRSEFGQAEVDKNFVHTPPSLVRVHHDVIMAA